MIRSMNIRNFNLISGYRPICEQTHTLIRIVIGSKTTKRKQIHIVHQLYNITCVDIKMWIYQTEDVIPGLTRNSEPWNVDCYKTKKTHVQIDKILQHLMNIDELRWMTNRKPELSSHFQLISSTIYIRDSVTRPPLLRLCHRTRPHETRCDREIVFRVRLRLRAYCEARTFHATPPAHIILICKSCYVLSHRQILFKRHIRRRVRASPDTLNSYDIARLHMMDSWSGLHCSPFAGWMPLRVCNRMHCVKLHRENKSLKKNVKITQHRTTRWIKLRNLSHRIIAHPADLRLRLSIPHSLWSWIIERPSGRRRAQRRFSLC